MRKCFRKDAFDVCKARICSDHFLDSDYDPAFLIKASLMPDVKPSLKTGAIPTQKLSASKSYEYVI